MASLQDLLDEEGFRRRNLKKSARQKGKSIREDSISLPIYICHDGSSVGLFKQRSEKGLRKQSSSLKSFPRESSKRMVSKSGISNSRRRISLDLKGAEPAIDEVAVQAVMSILGGYIGRFVKDPDFRNRIREVCKFCLADKDSDDEIIVNMELGMENIERYAESSQGKGDSKLSLLKNSVRLLNVVASLNSSHTRTALTCGIPNSQLSACAQLYLSIVYKLEKNDRSSAKHLLQVFCDSPSLARRTLLPDLWEHFFLPHLLHLKVWYSKEVEFISSAGADGLERRMALLNKVYDDHMDIGTSKFALYYKEWLKVGGHAPAVPSVPLPTRPSYEFSWNLCGSSNSGVSIRRNLYRDIFGNSFLSVPVVCERENDSFLDGYEKDHCLPEREAFFSREQEACRLNNDNVNNLDHMDSRRCNQSPTQNNEELKVALLPEVNRYQYIQFFPCHSKPASEMCSHGHANEKRVNTRKPEVCSFSLGDAITVICTSDNLSRCEIAVRFIAKAWLDSNGNATVEIAISKTPVIEGLLEVLFSSEDDEILELIISILAELVVRNDINRRVILDLDAELEIFIRLLKNPKLLPKAIVFLYLLKPQAKQLCLSIWIPLFLKVLEHGDQLQTLFTIRCSPQAAVLYFLNILMTGFDAERNMENVKLVIMLGGLKFLLKRLEVGSTQERKTAVSLLLPCIEADGKCRNYLARNIKKNSLLELFLNEGQKFGAPVLNLLTELLCLNRRTEINKFLKELKNEGSLNTMHILLSYLQWAPVEQRPLVAATILLLDLIGDPLKSSLFREEAMDAIVTTLDCNSNSTTVQEQMSKALSLLGGKFSYSGEASVESWLLKKAASYYEFTGKEIVVGRSTRLDEEEEAMESWVQRATTALLSSGKNRFLAGLSKAIANGIPCLSHTSLVTVAWISNSLVSFQNADIGLMATTLLTPCLVENLNSRKDEHEKLLSSLALANLARNLGDIQGQIMLSKLSKE
ncbi:hypothetical protein H6P81_019660 [Aristolochia fimbriata]|uniref:E3 ubiquitin-protein ligase LIN-1 n=1 Tax=Aristolochia fimbriata TaxID=158543 RepID=A0AAV7DTX9_ARIFI|nr:hypothetical protein H6P81_019660 [Aristolochia fimbriata]